jgi:hypothetical protein
MEREKETGNTDVYDITQYEKVFILLGKGSTLVESQAEKVHYDKTKNRYYFSGRILPKTLARYLSIPFIDEGDIKNYLKETKDHLKQKYIIYIPYSHIDFITLDFNSLDWKK